MGCFVTHNLNCCRTFKLPCTKARRISRIKAFCKGQFLRTTYTSHRNRSQMHGTEECSSQRKSDKWNEQSNFRYWIDIFFTPMLSRSVASDGAWECAHKCGMKLATTVAATTWVKLPRLRIPTVQGLNSMCGRSIHYAPLTCTFPQLSVHHLFLGPALHQVYRVVIPPPPHTHTSYDCTTDNGLIKKV